MKKIIGQGLIIFLVLPIRAQQMTAPAGSMDVAGLYQEFIQGVDPDEKKQIVDKISHTSPRTQTDIQDLYDLFIRFSASDIREAALTSLDLMDPDGSTLKPTFDAYLLLPDSESKMFALRGILRLKDKEVLPQVSKIAESPFTLKDPRFTPLVSERKNWWVHYEALSVLAQLEGAKTLGLLKRKSAEAPQIARIMALYLWKESFPSFVEWASKPKDYDRFAQAFSVPIPSSVLRENREEMLKILKDPKANAELRHQVALKVGLCSTEPEISSLVKDYADSRELQTKLLLASAIFISRSPQGIPILVDTVKNDKSASARIGALLELKELMKADEYRLLAEWMGKNDLDSANRKLAVDSLGSAPPVSK